MELFVAAVEALKKKERGAQNKMKMSLAQTNGAFLSFNHTPPAPALNANVLVLQVFFEP